MSAYWEQREEQLALRAAALFDETWNIIDTLISRYIGAHLTRSHTLKVLARAIQIIEEREVKKL